MRYVDKVDSFPSGVVIATSGYLKKALVHETLNGRSKNQSPYQGVPLFACGT